MVLYCMYLYNALHCTVLHTLSLYAISHCTVGYTKIERVNLPSIAALVTNMDGM